MKKKTIVVIALISALFIVFSIKPLIFTTNFFLYLANKNSPDKYIGTGYLINALSLNPGVYKHLFRKDRIDILIAAAVVKRNPAMMDALTDHDRMIAEKKYGNNVFFWDLMKGNSRVVDIHPESELTLILLGNEGYNPVTVAALRKIPGGNFLAIERKLLRALERTGNIPMIRFTRLYSRELKKRKERPI